MPHINDDPGLKSEYFFTYYEIYKGHLNRHIASFHEGTKKSRYNPFDKKTYNLTIQEDFEDYENDMSVSNQGKIEESPIKSEAHEGNKFNQCHKCGIVFVNKSNLRRHVKSTHEGKIRVFHSATCKICHTTIKDRNYMKRHIRTVHGNL